MCLLLKAPKPLWGTQFSDQLDFMGAMQMQKETELCSTGQTVTTKKEKAVQEQTLWVISYCS